jgi:hypothetical protein
MVCGFTEELGKNQYETPEGLIVNCTEEEAYERGYIFICPICLFNEITYWEKEDHGMCISCWHNENKKTFTNP